MVNPFISMKTHHQFLSIIIIGFSSAIFLTSSAFAADGKLISTIGVTQVEGSGGSGIVPWATLSGYDSREQISANAFFSRASVDDYDLDIIGLSASFYDRVEISLAQQKFNINTTEEEIKQDIIDIKTRLYGDVIYSTWPQVSLGAQHKILRDSTIANTLGADDSDSGTDFYLSFTKVHLGAAFGFNALWNTTFRYTDANQLGLLGFGGANGEREIVLETSAAIFLNRRLSIGIDYREKPNNLETSEDNWKNLFISYSPNKSISLTAAWLKLGSIAAINNQNGLYLSLTGHF